MADGKPVLVRPTARCSIARPTRALLAILLALMALGPLNALQGLAWCGMLVSRLATASPAEAVATTFDGDHPCALCSAVDAQRDHDARALCAHLIASVRAWLAAEPPAVDVNVAPQLVLRAPRAAPRLDSRRIAPPLPPPRA